MCNVICEVFILTQFNIPRKQHLVSMFKKVLSKKVTIYIWHFMSSGISTQMIMNQKMNREASKQSKRNDSLA